MTVALRAAVLMLAALSEAGAAAATSPWDGAQDVPKEDIVAAMRREQKKQYALDAISNAARLQMAVFLDLAGEAQKADPERRPLRIGHREYFAAFLEVTGLSAASAPVFASVPHGFGEDYLIDYRMENVLERAGAEKAPSRALNVKAGWPAAPGAPASYSYEDTSLDPNLEVTHAQVNAYRVLDFGELIVCDDIQGITGRATSGVLGFIFSVLGKARAEQTRFAVSAHGVQIARTTARKLIALTQTVTIYPDGRVLPGVPADRPELQKLEELLKDFNLEVRYRPLDLSPVPPAPAARAKPEPSRAKGAAPDPGRRSLATAP
jgi:hypothetical protein